MELNSKKGMTLIEVVIALAILGIISISFLTMFTFGFKSIAMAGNGSKAQYATQEKIEQDINNKVMTPNEDTLHIVASDSSYIDVSGDIKMQTTNIQGKNVDIYFFMPNR